MPCEECPPVVGCRPLRSVPPCHWAPPSPNSAPVPYVGGMPRRARKRLFAKQSVPELALPDGVPLPRRWRRVKRCEEGGIGGTLDKVSEWYANPAALMEEFPLSPDAASAREDQTLLTPDIKVKSMRQLMVTLESHPAHSFHVAPGNQWRSLSAEAMATYYEDALLHEVGKRRMDDWWKVASPGHHDCMRVGAALTFWYSLDDSKRLPDAIEAGMRSTLLGEFDAVFCLSYQKFENVPSHIVMLDCNEILPFGAFKYVLSEGTRHTKGFIAVLAEWIKLVGAVRLQELQSFSATTTFDGDSLWQSRAIPPRMKYGHASATLEVNKVSRENRDKGARLERLTYEYCRYPRDFMKIATPWRWPKGSPALQSLVMRIMPMISSSGNWRGGENFEVIMNVAWDTYNNWGLREAFNDPWVHTPVPFFAWERPLKAGSASNPKWGVPALRARAVVCVNALWQSSAVDGGPSARSRSAWEDGSLVSSLVDHTIARCHERAMTAPTVTPWREIEHFLCEREILTVADQAGMVRVHSGAGKVWPDVLQAHKTLILLRRLVWSTCIHDIFEICGFNEQQKYSFVGCALKMLGSIRVKSVMDRPLTRVFTEKRQAALAVAVLAAPLALEHDGERAMKGIIYGREGPRERQIIESMECVVLGWQVGRGAAVIMAGPN